MNTQKQTLFHNLIQQGLQLPYSEDIANYRLPLSLYGKELSNRIGIQPLEGFDSDSGGGPTDMVYRRYLRFVRGGSSLIWFEACAVSEDGKSNPYQMSLTDANVDDFKKLIQTMDQTAKDLGQKPPVKVLQLTHSGRVSKDQNWNPLPLAAKMSAEEESQTNADISCLATDERIRQMIQQHIHAAELAALAGFDAVDIKVCHGYFFSELLSAFHRPGPYGGSFENRTRALFEIVDGIQKAQIPIGIAVRLNAFDSVAYPYGYGITESNERLKPELDEAIKICQMLAARGTELINISASSPSCHLFGEEPAEKQYQKYVSSTDLLEAVKRIKKEVPDVKFMCTGLSAFGSLGQEIGAGGIAEGWFDIAGFGRQALAYPDFAKDLQNGSSLDANKCCVNCNNCFQLMDPGHTMTGCIVRDKEIYFPLYKENVLNHK